MTGAVDTRLGWTQSQAIRFCKSLQRIVSPYNWLVALAGGCLYKEGLRPDLDILMLNHSQYEPSLDDLRTLLCYYADTVEDRYYGYKTTFDGGKRVDITIVQRR